jgi:P-type E1-E2 ATPase
VIVLTPKGKKEVLVRDLLPGDIILLKQGAIVPVDGKILKGEVEVDEFLISGDIRPFLKKRKKGQSSFLVVYPLL